MERTTPSTLLKLSDRAPYFSLRGTDGKIYSLPDFVGKKALCIIFTCNHCPYAQAYEGRIVELAKMFEPRGAQFIAVCSNDASRYPEDDFEHMVEKSKILSLTFPYLHDIDQIMARAYDAACTPECYLFDKDQKLVYHGRIDDNYRDAQAAECHDLRDAIGAVLAGETPSLQQTAAVGCSIKWKP